MNKYYKNSSGITIIALVITLIIILIIASIAVMALGGENNIVNQALNAQAITTQKDVESEVTEQWLLVQNEAKTTYFTNEEIASKLQDKLSRNYNQASVAPSATGYTVVYKGYTINLDINGTIKSVTTPE